MGLCRIGFHFTLSFYAFTRFSKSNSPQMRLSSCCASGARERCFQYTAKLNFRHRTAQNVKASRRILFSLLITLAICLPLSWPLPKMMSDTMPWGATKRMEPPAELSPMIPGDHIQFLYYMLLANDFIAGQTPLFYNLYEFNTGNDEARYSPGSYYLPFSLAFSVFHLFGTPAFAWNASIFLAAWLAYLFTWLLALRYTSREGIAATAALFALLLPFQWVQLFGGSPAGFGMVMIPLLLLGIDRAVRDDQFSGGLIAGIAIFFASCTDTHVFFFGALLIPVWCIVAFTQRASFNWQRPAAYWRLTRALAPLLILAILALLQTQIGTDSIQETASSAGRTIGEVKLFSPRWQGLWAWRSINVTDQIYLGYIITALLALGGFTLTTRAIRARRGVAMQRGFLFALVCVGIAGTVALAMGPFGPFRGKLFALVRDLVPNYEMIRQPAKIFVILPALLGIGAALTLDAVVEARPRLPRWLLPVLGLLIAAEYYSQTRVSLSRISDTNTAYAAVAQDAQTRAKKARAMVLPLWPGDSHFASIYQYYSMLYRIRMINGYSPFVPTEYIEGVFDRYETLNLGYASEQQLDQLLSLGIDHLLLHEDLYPEKVSAFPIGTALSGLLNNPRIVQLQQDGPVWAFRILPTAEARAPVATNWNFYFPANHLEAERQRDRDAGPGNDASASGGAYIHLADDAYLNFNSVSTLAFPEMRWWVRTRGNGLLRIDRLLAGTSIGIIEQAVDFAEWSWLEIPAGTWDGAQEVSLKFTVAEGTADIDLVKLSAGEWDAMEPGESLEIPAPVFFHAGNTDIATDSVNFLTDRDRRGLLFYGPKLPLAPGRYQIRVDATVSHTGDGRAGQWIAACPEGAPDIGQTTMTAGTPTILDITVPNNQPFLLAFVYDATEDVSIHRITFTRQPD